MSMIGSREWSSFLAGGSARIEYGLWASIVTGFSAGLLLLTVWYMNKRRISSIRSHSLPPGPAVWPVIGNMHLIAKGGMLLHHALASLAKEYGPLMTLKLGSHTAVVVTSAKMAKEILKTQNQYFCSRWETAVGDIMHYHRQNIVWAPYGDHLRTVRKISQTELMSNKRIASFAKLREEELASAVYSILEDCKEGTVPVVLDETMLGLTTNNISRMLFGKSFFGRNAESFTDKTEFLDLISDVMEMSGTLVIGDFLPFLKRFDIGGYEAKMAELADKSDKFYSRILEEHRTNSARKNHTHDDFVDTLLALPAKDALSDTAIKGLLADIIAAGTDTSAHQVCWTFAELMRHPEVVRKAVEELDSVVGRDRLLTESDIPNLKYLQAIIKESFRLHPVGVLLPYESTEATVVQAYYIPVKTRVFVNNYAISRSPESWDNALEFIPERFLESTPESTRDVKGQDFEMLPFGSGRRMCVGMNMGLVVVQLTVGQMLHVCNWSLPPDMKPHDVDLTEHAGITIPMKNPLKLIATHRLAPSILNDFIASLD